MRRLQASQNSSADTIDLLFKNSFETFEKFLFNLGLFPSALHFWIYKSMSEDSAHLACKFHIFSRCSEYIYGSQMSPPNALPRPLPCAPPEQGQLPPLSAQQTLFLLLPSQHRATPAGHGGASRPVLSHHLHREQRWLRSSTSSAMRGARDSDSLSWCQGPATRTNSPGYMYFQTNNFTEENTRNLAPARTHPVP